MRPSNKSMPVLKVSSTTPRCIANDVDTYMNNNEQAAIDNGYSHIREIDGVVCGLMRFMYTVGVCYGIDAVGYSGRFCFSNHLNAVMFLQEWDGATPPVIGEDGCTAIK